MAAIDFFEGDKINERALKNLVRAAVDYVQSNLDQITRLIRHKKLFLLVRGNDTPLLLIVRRRKTKAG